MGSAKGRLPPTEEDSEGRRRVGGAPSGGFAVGYASPTEPVDGRTPACRTAARTRSPGNYAEGHLARFEERAAQEFKALRELMQAASRRWTSASRT